MKKIFIFSLLVLIVFTMYSTERFNEKYHIPNVLIVGFDANAIQTTVGDMPIHRTSRGFVQIGIESFDSLAVQYQFNELKRMFYAKNKDFVDENGIYTMNIFRVFVADNSQIDAAFDALQNEPSVIYVEYEGIVFPRSSYIPNDPDFNRQWMHPMIKTPELWQYYRGGKDIIIGIVDSGTKWNHEDLRDNIWENPAEINNMTINWASGTISGPTGGTWPGNIYGDILGWNFNTRHGESQSNDSYQNYHRQTHGTLVAGVVGAVGDNYIGISGISPVASMLTTRHTRKNGYSNDPNDPDGIVAPYEGLMYMYNRGAKVVNCSWGGPTNQSQTANNVINNGLNMGAVTVVAAGNDGYLSVTGTYNNWPANALNAIAVGSSNSQDVKATHSEYGPLLALLAPGQNIYSTSFTGNANNTYDNYESVMGTSFAAPVVSAVAAMVMEMNPHLLASEIKQRLMDTADPMPNEPLWHQGLVGAGRINAFKAVMCDYLPYMHIDGEITIAEHEGDGDGVPNIGEILSLSFSLQNESGWSASRNTIATISSDFVGVEIIQDTITFNTNIDAGETSPPNNFALFRVTRAVDILDIPLKITVTSNQEATNAYPYSRAIDIIAPLSMSKAGWPIETGNESTAGPIVTDLDGTGQRIISISGHEVHVLDADKNYNTGFPFGMTNTINNDFAVGDVARNGNKQIVIASSTGQLIVLSHTGEVLAERALGQAVRNTPIIADLNNNGHNEIIVTTQSQLFVLNGNDLSVWDNFPISLGGNILSNFAVGDLTGDGIKNIVVGASGSSGGINAINPLTAENIPGFPYSLTSGSYGPTLVNLSGGTGLDIVLSGSGGNMNTVFVIKNDGTLYKQTTVASAIRTEIAVGDLFMNNVPYLVFGDMNGNLYVLNSELENITGFPKNTGVRIDSSPVFADVNYRGYRSIIFGDDDGRINIVDAHGNYHLGFPLKVSYSPIRRTPWVGNIGSNRISILLSVHNGIDFIDTKLGGSFPAWNSHRGNIGRTACFTDPRVPIGSGEIPTPYTNHLEQNYPNPFNPETTISFTLAQNGNVQLSIYNIRGQLVRTLLNENRSAGLHNVLWNGTDNNNNQVASGIYLYRIETNTFSDVKRMMLMK